MALVPIISSPPAINNDLVPRYFFTPDPEDTPIGSSVLGTPVYSNLIFIPDGLDVGSPTTVDPDAGKRPLRVDTVLMSVVLPKVIIKTEIQGRNGSIKEYISDGDYMIDIRGAIVSPYPNVFPREDVDLLHKYCKIGASIPVISDFLDLFGITDIVVEELRCDQVLGTYNQVNFQIRAVSDRPIEFQLNPSRGL